MDTTGVMDNLKKKVHLYTIGLGIALLILAQFAGTSHARGLYSIIALGPVIGGLATLVRLQYTRGLPKDIAKIVVECGWVALSFGLGFFMMVPSAYYALSGGLTALVLVVAAALVGLGLYVLLTIRKLGFSLTP